MKTKRLNNGLKLQFNPARMVSTGAKIDKATIAKRPCFLCKDNRPQVQISLPFGEEFDILVNPFPICLSISPLRHVNISFSLYKSIMLTCKNLAMSIQNLCSSTTVLSVAQVHQTIFTSKEAQVACCQYRKCGANSMLLHNRY